MGRDAGGLKYRHLTLGAEVVHASNLGPASLIYDYNETLYVFIDKYLYYWDEVAHELKPAKVDYGPFGIHQAATATTPVAANLLNGDMLVQDEGGILGCEERARRGVLSPAETEWGHGL
ncbi:MAG: hypothetical protein M5T61_09825 [Acidimicrobiia bacterium]|nr:hypothetical protein [Acidimicrobiia bacterium]